jgi:hypothetical protein
VQRSGSVPWAQLFFTQSLERMTTRAAVAALPVALLLLLLLLFSISPVFAGADSAVPRRQAYVTLVYGDVYALAARVMFQSLKDTGTQKELLALVADDVSPKSVEQV